MATGGTIAPRNSLLPQALSRRYRQIVRYHQLIHSILTPPLEAGTILWGFQRGRASPLVKSGVKSPPAKWLRLIERTTEACSRRRLHRFSPRLGRLKSHGVAIRVQIAPALDDDIHGGLTRSQVGAKHYVPDDRRGDYRYHGELTEKDCVLRLSCAAGRGDCTAEARRARSKEFLIKKFPELCELCASVVNTSSQEVRSKEKD